MSKSRIFPRTPRPKLQPRPLADRVRRTNISISGTRRPSITTSTSTSISTSTSTSTSISRHRERGSHCNVETHDKNSNSNGGNGNSNSKPKHDRDNYWHRQELGNTYVTPPLPPPRNRDRAGATHDRKLVIRLKPLLPLLIAIFVCVVFIDSVQWVNRQYDTTPVKVPEAIWENTYTKYDHDTNTIPDYDLGTPKTFSDNEPHVQSVQYVLGTSNSIPAINNVAGIGTHMQTKEQIRIDGDDTDTLHIVGDAIPTQRVTHTKRQGIHIDQEDAYLAKTIDETQYTKVQKGNGSRLRYSPGIPLPNQHAQEKMDFLGIGLKQKKFKPTKQLLKQVKTSPHTISGLNCVLYGGPTSTACQDLVYWKDIPSDSEYTSPFYYSKEQHQQVHIMDDDITANQRSYLRGNEMNRDSTNKYIIFEPDNSGWNSQRMAFETAVTLSAAMGRTLVLPPRHDLRLLSEGSQTDRILSYDDFYHLDSLNEEYEGIHIITMEEFLSKEALNGNLFKYGTSDCMFVPHNRTNWDDLASDEVVGSTSLSSLWDFLRSVSYIAESWNPNECIAAFPATAAPQGNKGLSDLMQDILLQRDRRPKPQHLDYQGRPIPADAAPIERMREMMAGRSRLCLYNDEMQSATVVHFPPLASNSKSRLLTHYYSFVFFEQWRQAMWTNRLVRDHIRYRDEIMCAAARVVEAIQKYSMQQGSHGYYDSIHIRRNKFQNSGLVNISEEVIFDSLSDVEMGSTIFVASDEKIEIFFTRLHEKYNLVFLKDYRNLLGGINVNYYGMVEQIVLSRGNQFHGTFFSTFSGHISRLRGYYSERDKLLGYDEGKLTNTYLMPRIYRNELRVYQAIQQPFFAREFPIAWRDVDRGVGEMIWKDWQKSAFTQQIN